VSGGNCAGREGVRCQGLGKTSNRAPEADSLVPCPIWAFTQRPRRDFVSPALDGSEHREYGESRLCGTALWLQGAWRAVLLSTQTGAYIKKDVKNADRTRNVYENKGNSDKMPDKLSGLWSENVTKLANLDDNSSVLCPKFRNLHDKLRGWRRVWTATAKNCYDAPE
jgi:hypothetical protein